MHDPETNIPANQETPGEAQGAVTPPSTEPPSLPQAQVVPQLADYPQYPVASPVTSSEAPSEAIPLATLAEKPRKRRSLPLQIASASLVGVVVVGLVIAAAIVIGLLTAPVAPQTMGP